MPMLSKILSSIFIIAMACHGLSAPMSAYLMLPSSARDEALGGAFPCHIANPAFTYEDKYLFVETGYRNRFGDANDNFLLGSMRWGKFSAFAQLSLFGISDIEGRSIASQEPEYLFSANRVNFAFGGTYLLKNLWLGISMRHVHERIEFATMDANTFSGGIYASIKNFSVGISATDYGSDDRFIEYFYPPPTTYRAQAAYVWEMVAFGASFIKPDMYDGYGVAALEISPISWMVLRSSYAIKHPSRSFSFGTGFLVKNFSLDYALASYGELGINHFVSIGYSIPKMLDNTKTE